MSATPRITVTKREAAEALGMSVDSLEQYVMPHVRVIRRGRLVLVPVKELQRWADAEAALTLEPR